MHCRPHQPILSLACAVSLAYAIYGSTNPISNQSTLSSHSNTPSLKRSPFQVRHWTTEKGLPQNRIACLKQTRDGYLWIGTWNGLVRFDGVRFTVFNHLNTPELKNAPINALAEEEDGTLWVGTRDGLVSYRALRFHRLAGAPGVAGAEGGEVAPAR